MRSKGLLCAWARGATHAGRGLAKEGFPKQVGSRERREAEGMCLYWGPRGGPEQKMGADLGMGLNVSRSRQVRARKRTCGRDQPYHTVHLLPWTGLTAHLRGQEKMTFEELIIVAPGSLMIGT